MIKATCAAIALLLMTAPVARAQDKKEAPASAPTSDRKEQVDAVKKEFEDARTAFFAKYKEAKTDEEREKIGAEYPSPAPQVKKLWVLVDANPKDEAAADALLWIQQQGNEKVDKEKVRETFLAHHLKSTTIGRWCMDLTYDRTKGTLEVVEKVLAETPHDSVRVMAKWTKGALLMGMAGPAETLQKPDADAKASKRYQEYFGADTVAWLKTLDVADAKARAEALYEEVVKGGGDVKPPYGDGSLADMAKGELFEIRNLAIGKTAPDIVGKDADGVEFKLSDFRGKVVVLDFWGFW